MFTFTDLEGGSKRKSPNKEQPWALSQPEKSTFFLFSFLSKNKKHHKNIEQHKPFWTQLGEKVRLNRTLVLSSLTVQHPTPLLPFFPLLYICLTPHCRAFSILQTFVTLSRLPPLLLLFCSPALPFPTPAIPLTWVCVFHLYSSALASSSFSRIPLTTTTLNWCSIKA